MLAVRGLSKLTFNLQIDHQFFEIGIFDEVILTHYILNGLAQIGALVLTFDIPYKQISPVYFILAIDVGQVGVVPNVLTFRPPGKWSR